MIKAVFFDLDETLVDSMRASRESNLAAFKEFGYDYNEIKAKTSRLSSMGKKVSEALKIRLEGAGITEEQIPLQKLLEVRKKYFFQFAKEYARLYPGVIRVLEELKKRKIIIAIVSSSTNAYIALSMDKFQLHPYIDFVISADEVEKGKPNPECYEKAYQYLLSHFGKFAKTECLVVEDTENGIIAAHSAGLKTVLVPSPYSIIPKTIQPDYQYKSLEEFDPEILQ